jgi:hypothetical protein
MCFDFTVRFTNNTRLDFENIKKSIWEYFDQKQDFFHTLGYKKYDPALGLGGITLGKIIKNQPNQNIIELISKHQCLKNIKVV